MQIIVIAAVDAHWGIARDNNIPWQNTDDLKLFARRSTRPDACVLMGRKTWQSLPQKPLRGRLNAVLSTQMLQNMPIPPHRTASAGGEVSPCALAPRCTRLDRYPLSGGVPPQRPPHPSEWDPQIPMVSGTADALLAALRGLGLRYCFVIGGEQVYRWAMSKASALYLSLFDGNYACDQFLPDPHTHGFVCVRRTWMGRIKPGFCDSLWVPRG